MPEIELTQYLRPDGRKVQVFAPVSQEVADIARRHKLVLSCEVLTTGDVAIYARWAGQREEDEEMILAENGPGSNGPAASLEKLIRRFEK